MQKIEQTDLYSTVKRKKDFNVAAIFAFFVQNNVQVNLYSFCMHS